MTTAATSLLGLALPVTGELAGTWGTTVNDSITSLLDTAVAGTTTLSTDADVTLTTTTLAANQARQAILLCSGARTALRTITAPAQSKIYTIINATTGGFSVKLVGVGPTTGLTIPNGASAVVAWNGSDFIEVGSATVGNLTVNGNLSVTGTTSLTGVATLTANPVLSAGTANGVAYLNGSKVVTTGSALTFNGTIFAAPRVRLNDANRLDWGDSGEWIVGDNGGAMLFGVDAAEQMRLTSTGLGIGTSSPSYKLDVSNTSAGAYVVSRINNLSATGYSRLLFEIGSNGANGSADISYVPGTFFAIGPSNNDTTTPIVFRNNNATERMRLDSSGNLGLGVTPSAWNSTSKAIQVSAFVSVSQQASGAANFGFNFYEDAANTFKYSTTDEACRFSALTTGGFGWFTAASGTAGNAITFTQAMTLDASGNLGIGTSSPGNRLHVSSAASEIARFNSSTDGYIRITQSGSAETILGGVSTTGFVGTLSNSDFVFRTNNSERARFNTSGNLGINNTSPAFKLDVIGTDVCRVKAGSSNATDNPLVVWNNATTGDNRFIFFQTEGTATNRGSITYNRAGGLVAYNTSSDYRLKENIVDLPNPLAIVAQLKPRQFDWKETKITTTGFIAHELSEVCPHAVTGEKDAVDAEGNPQYQGIDTSFLVATLTAAIQEQQALITKLTDRITALEAK